METAAQRSHINLPKSYYLTPSLLSLIQGTSPSQWCSNISDQHLIVFKSPSHMWSCFIQRPLYSATSLRCLLRKDAEWALASSVMTMAEFKVIKNFVPYSTYKSGKYIFNLKYVIHCTKMEVNTEGWPVKQWSA